jgi:protein-arginine kinase activator protein McsA
MNCEICGKDNATVHLTTIMSEKTTKIDLCETCAKEHGVHDPTGFSLLDLMKKIEARRGRHDPS